MSNMQQDIYTVRIIVQAQSRPRKTTTKCQTEKAAKSTGTSLVQSVQILQ